MARCGALEVAAVVGVEACARGGILRMGKMEWTQQILEPEDSKFLPGAIWWLLVSLQRWRKRGWLRLGKAGSSGLLVTAVTSWQMEEWELGDQCAAFGGRGLGPPGASRSYVHSLSPVSALSHSDQQIQAPEIPENQEPADGRDGS